MVCADLAVERDASFGQQRGEITRGEVSRIFDGQRLGGSSIVQGDIAPDGEAARTGLAVDVDAARPGAVRRSQNAVVDRIILREWIYVNKCFVSGIGAGKDADEHHVVVDGESGDRSTPLKDEIVLRPSFAVTLVGEVAVVGDDVSLDLLDAACDDLIREFVKYMERCKLALRAQRVRERSSRKIGIAAANEADVAYQPAILVDDAGGLDGGVELVVRADEGE